MKSPIRIALLAGLISFSLLAFQNCGDGFRATSDSSQSSHLESPEGSSPTADDPQTSAPVNDGQTGTETPAAKEEPRPEVDVGDNYANAGFAWGESYNLSHLLLQFETTKNPELLLQFFDRVTAVLKKRDDRSARYTRRATWTMRSLYETNFGKSPVDCSDAGIDGMIITPMTEFLALAKQKPALFTKISAQTLANEQEKIKSAVREVFTYHQGKSWNAAIGTYRTHADCAAVDSRNRVMRESPRLPFNLVAAMGRAHFNYYLAEGDPAELQKVIAIARDLKNHFQYGANGELFWPYWSVDADRPEDLSHGAIVAGFIHSLAKHGVVFNIETVGGLDKTLRFHILGTADRVMQYIGARKDVSSGCLNPADSADYYECRPLALWLPFAPNKTWVDAAKRFIHPDNGAFGKLAKTHAERNSRAKAYGAACAFDEECATGSCYAGTVCGYKLGTGSTCKLDSDCLSGHCYAGAICGNPLGAGSTCTRHHECVSGFCTAKGNSKSCN